MSVSVSSVEEYGRLVRIVYTDEEIKKAWNEQGQGHNQAVGRGPLCVVRECNEAEALALSRVFGSHFSIPTCVTYDGDTISMYCGDAGGGYALLRAWCEGLFAKEYL